MTERRPDHIKFSGRILFLTDDTALIRQQLEQALRERVELRQPARLARAGGIALGFTLLLLGALWVLRRVYRALGVRMQRLAEHQIERTSLASHVAVDATLAS